MPDSGAPLAFAAPGKKLRVATWLLALISPHPSFHCVKTKTVKCQDGRNGFLSQSAPDIKPISKQTFPCHRENPKEEKTIHFSVLFEASLLLNSTALSCDFLGQLEKPRAYPRLQAGM